MEAEIIEVKVEPFDDYDDEYENLQTTQEESQVSLLTALTAITPSIKMEFNTEEELIIKDENDTGGACTLEMEDMSIVEEQPNLITVTAGFNKSEDEKNFMADCVAKAKFPRRRKQVFFNKVCLECQQSFNLRRSYEQHKEFGLCTIPENKKRCLICPLSFSSQAEVDEHLKLHKLNRFFCIKNCGKFFNTLDECQQHEYSEHQGRSILCNVCNHKFFSCNALINHMKSHSALKRFVCSFCRDWFSCSIDLAKHWQVQKNTCGKLMQDVVHHTMMTIEKTLPVFNITPKIQFEDNFPLKKSFVSLNDLQIKGDFGVNDNQQSALSNATSVKPSMMEFFTNITIKSELENSFCDAFKMKNEPVSDNDELEHQNMVTEIQQNKFLFNENRTKSCVTLSQHETASVYSQMRSNLNDNLTLSNISLLKKAPVISADFSEADNIIHLTQPTVSTKAPTSVKPLQLQNQNIKLPPINLTGYKIFKILPNAKFLRLPSSSVGTVTNKTALAPIFLKLKSPPDNTTKRTKCSVTGNSPSSVTSTEGEKIAATQLKLSSIEDSRVCTDTSMDYALICRQRKNYCKSKSELHQIESIPQKRAIIDNMKAQIKQFSSESGEIGNCYNDRGLESLKALKNITVTVEDNGQISENGVDDESDNALIIDEKNYETMKPPIATGDIPPTFFISVISDIDPELQAARRKYPYYRFRWKCPRCPRKYAQKYSFRSHLVLVHGITKEELGRLFAEVKPFHIPSSLEERNSSPTRQAHAIADSENESEESSNTNQLGEANINHNINKDASDGERKFPAALTCLKCGRKCCTRTALNDHIMANCSREPQYPCLICPKRFYSASTLNQHVSIHTGDLPYKCNYCDKRFRTRGQVTVHHRTHTGERPFECQVCSQRFTHRETLISHLSRHIGMRRYKCYGCNQQFACISGLKTHREVRRSTCGKVKLNTRAVGPRVRVIKGNVVFEPQPEINPYLRTEDPEKILSKFHQNRN